MTIQAIETRYAGCRFRSRLEARWAVFFDHLGIKWQYEHQGYRVGRDARPYLPDFTLPELGSFVEVKGEPDRLDLNLLADAIEVEKVIHWMLILGDIPRYDIGEVPLHSMLQPVNDFRQPGTCWDDAPPFSDRDQMYAAVTKHEVLGSVWRHETRSPVLIQPCTFVPHTEFGAFVLPVGHPNLNGLPKILNPDPVWWLMPHYAMRDAYEAARSARFEHGERS